MDVAGELLVGENQSLEPGTRADADRLADLLARSGWDHYFQGLQAAQLGLAGYWFLANPSLAPCLVHSGAVMRHWLPGLSVNTESCGVVRLQHASEQWALFGAALLLHLHRQATGLAQPAECIQAGRLPEPVASYLGGLSARLEQRPDQVGVLLTLSDASWQAPFLTGNRQLLPLLADSLSFLEAPVVDSVAAKVYGWLEQVAQLGDANQSQAAHALAMSDRTLSRQLAEEGTSFRELLVRLRNSRAIARLCEGEGIDALAAHLGFSERAAFERAFKAWQGVTPAKFQAQYRRLSRDVDIERLLAPEQLPTLPALANQLLAMAQDDNASIDDMAAVVEQDPVLTAKLLNIACSAYYGLPPGTRIRDAVIRVFGVQKLRYLALTMLAAGGLGSKHCPAFSMSHFWLVSLGVAQLASDLYRLAGKSAAEQADIYLTGLLHIIGRLVLVQCFPAKMQALLASLATPPAPQEMLAMEKLRLGVDTSEAGALLVAKWQLPRSVSVLMRQLAGAKDAEDSQAALLLCLHEYILLLLSQNTEKLADIEQQLAQLTGVKAQTLVAACEQFAERLPELQAMARTIQ